MKPKMTFQERAELAKKQLSEQKPVTLEEVRAQVLQLFKWSLKKNATLDEKAIWIKTELTELERMETINKLRRIRKRAELEARWLFEDIEEKALSKPKHLKKKK